MNRSMFSLTCKGWSEVRAMIKIVGQIIADRRQFLVHALAELGDLLAFTHLNRQGDGAAAMPAAVLVSPGEVVQIARRTLVARAIYQPGRASKPDCSKRSQRWR